jgi:hypothetical protein
VSVVRDFLAGKEAATNKGGPEMSRHPRAVQEIMKGEVMILITGPQALDRLMLDCKFPEEKARRILNIAWEFGQKAEPCPGGYVHVWYHGKDDTDAHVFSVVEHIGNVQMKGLAKDPEKGYTQGRTVPNRSGKAKQETTKGNTMPPRKARTAAPEPEVAEQNGGEVDFQKYLTKPLSATMTDYVEWFEANVGNLDKIEVDRILVLGTTMYSHFQRSDFNIERREARRAEREEAAPEPEVAAPARSGRARSTAKATPAKPATATRTAPKAPAGRASGKAKTRATAPAGDAPF